MGQCAAINIIGQLGIATQPGTDSFFSPVELPPFPTMMALAVGGDAVSIDMNGSLDSGRRIREGFFGDDLALASMLTSSSALLRSMLTFLETRELLGLSDKN